MSRSTISSTTSATTTTMTFPMPMTVTAGQSGFLHAVEGRPQDVEADGAEVEVVAMEDLEIEGRALARLRRVARREPDPLPDLVRRRLPRPAQVAVELEAQILVRDPAVRPHELPAQFRRPPLAGVEGERVVARDLQFQVHSEVDDHPRRAERLAVEHAELVARVGEVAQLVHEALGVQRPALAVPGHPAQQPLPAVEQLRPVGRLGNLQVMAGGALVVD